MNFGYLEAGAVIEMVPCVLLYVGLQRFGIRGLMSGVVKGQLCLPGDHSAHLCLAARAAFAAKRT